MGRGSSKSGGGSKGRKTIGVSSVSLPDGSSIDLSGNPLVYGDNDANVSGKAREAIEAWETKRGKNKVEYNMSVDQNGNQLGPEVRGGKNSVRVPYYQLQEGAIHTHIHPREDSGLLGGTFSDGDLRNFARNGVSTYRAKAKEGTYSISKGSNFDKSAFSLFVNEMHSKESSLLESKARDMRKKISSDSSYTYKQYSADFNKAFNSYLVALHNGLRDNQKKYGYTYTLEGGK